MNNLRLSIQEIADLKEGRKTLEEIEKTHDGTSSGPIKSGIRQVVDECDSAYRVSVVLSEDGKQLWSTDGKPELMVTDKKKKDRIPEETESIMNELGNEKNIHIITKSSTESSNQFWRDEAVNDGVKVKIDDKNLTEYEFPWGPERDRLFLKNNDGDYLVRSVTNVGPDGTSVTLIKNNDFVPENEKTFNGLYNKMYSASSEYRYNLGKEAFEMSRKEFSEWEKNNPEPPRGSAEEKKWFKDYDKKSEELKDKYLKKLMDEKGDTKTFIMENYAPQIEEECNIKIKIQDYPDVKGPGYDRKKLKDYDNYKETWSDVNNTKWRY